MYDLVLFTHHFYNENELLPSAVLHRLKIIKKSQALNNLNPEENEAECNCLSPAKTETCIHSLLKDDRLLKQLEIITVIFLITWTNRFLL